MIFFIARLILVLYYIRPQDWFPGLAGLNIMKPVILAGIYGLFNQPRGIGFRNLFRTPVDWAVLFYGIYIVVTSDTALDTFKAFYPLVVYFLITSQAIQREEQFENYLKLWAGLLVAVALLAVASLYGIDITGARAVTESQQGRLALGTYMLNNPNALGHSVVAAIPLTYVFWFSRQPLVSRLVAVLCWWLVCYCIDQTQSRGAFVVCGGGMLLSFTFGKPKLVQALLISLALVGGGSAMAIMPRMGKGIRSDEGVQGRMLAWEQARLAMQTNRYGVGYEKFHAFIRWKEGRYLRVIPKATHGSYINIGADLGYPGMFFYMLVIAASLRTAMLPIPIAGRDRLRRARDALFLFLAMSVVSGWMIDRAYALEFFLLAACFSAFHRILLRENEELRAVEKGEGEVPNPDAEQSEVELRSAVPAVTYGPDLKPTLVLPSAAKAQIVRPLWRRLGVIEFVLAGGFTYATVAVWDRILSSFLW